MSFLAKWFQACAGGDAVIATREYQNAASISSGKPPRRGAASKRPKVYFCMPKEGWLYVPVSFTGRISPAPVLLAKSFSPAQVIT
jgi:hypothetical protein